MKIRLASPLQPDSIVDGEGIRTVLWTQGCPHKCVGCHNPGTHDFNGGYEVDIEDIKEELSRLEYQDGITLSGGEPLSQPKAILEICKYAKSLKLNIWCYTGFTFEELLASNDKIIKELLTYIDVLIDGKFMLELRNFDIKYRGSTNQRIIDMKASLKKEKIIIKKGYKYIQKKEKVLI